MFLDRRDAGRQLADHLRHLHGRDVVVLGLPRGGVPVAAEVARVLDAPLDVLAVRKLGVPGQSELAMGAIGEGDVKVTNPDVIHVAAVTADEMSAVERREREVLTRGLAAIRDIRPATPLVERTVVIVDDGVATGATASAACRVARARGAGRVILAVPVIAASAADALRQEADEVIAVTSPKRLAAVGEWYDDFSATPDRQVYECLAAARRPGDSARDSSDQDASIDDPAVESADPGLARRSTA